MEDFLDDHIPKQAKKNESYIRESDTYGRHLETTINRRLYLGQIEESSILFMPKRDSRGLKEMVIDVAPSIVSLWVVGLSVLYTYPRSVKMFRFIFPNIRSFAAIHIGIAPFMMFFNLNLLGICKGVSYVYFRRITDTDIKTT